MFLQFASRKKQRNNCLIPKGAENICLLCSGPTDQTIFEGGKQRKNIGLVNRWIWNQQMQSHWKKHRYRALLGIFILIDAECNFSA